MRRRIYELLGLACLILVALACQAPVASTPTGTSPPTQTIVPTWTATPTQTIMPSSTVAPTPTATPTVTPAPPTETPPPTPTSPTRTPSLPSPTPSGQAVIHYFRARAADGTELEAADPGDTIRLEWSWSRGTGATIYHMFGWQLSEPYWDVGPSGSREYTISPQARNHDDFVLFVNDAQGLAAQETLEIELRCPDAWFFEPAPDGCPSGPPIVTDGAEQHFQRGVMVWNRAEGRVYVLFADGQGPAWQAYEDKFDEGEDPDSDPSIEPPAGLYQPIRGFGMVWREQPSVRDRLGWAVDTESGYETAIQRTSYIKYNHIYIRALDGGVWRLGPERSDWEHLSLVEER